MWGAWDVLRALEMELGRPLSYAEVLALIIHFEYGTTLYDYPEWFDVALEATGRQFYSICGGDGLCGGNQLWRFLGAHAAWTMAAHRDDGSRGTIGQGRFDEMIGLLTGSNSDFTIALNGAETILNTVAWRTGKQNDRPFFYGNYGSPPGPGLPPNTYSHITNLPEKLKSGVNVDVGGGLYFALHVDSSQFLVLTPNQLAKLWQVAN